MDFQNHRTSTWWWTIIFPCRRQALFFLYFGHTCHSQTHKHGTVVEILATRSVFCVQIGSLPTKKTNLKWKIKKLVGRQTHQRRSPPRIAKPAARALTNKTRLGVGRDVGRFRDQEYEWSNNRPQIVIFGQDLLYHSSARNAHKNSSAKIQHKTKADTDTTTRTRIRISPKKKV